MNIIPLGTGYKRILFLSLLLFVGMYLTNEFVLNWKINIWSQRFLHRSISSTEYEEFIYNPPNEHKNAYLWLAREALISDNILIAHSMIEPLISSGDYQALSIYGDILISKNKIDRAIEIWSEIGDISSLLEFGKIAEMKGNWDEATKAYEKVLIYDPRNSSIYFSVGQTLAQQKKYDEADLWFQRAIDIIPRREWLLTRARVSRNAGNLLLSQEIYEKIISKYPEFAQAYFEIAWVYYQEKKYGKAEISIELAIHYSHLPKSNYYIRAGRIYEKVGKEQKAIEAYEKVLNIEPGNNVALKRLKQLQLGN